MAKAAKLIGPQVRICQLNIEGISKAKSDYLSRLLSDEKVDVVLIQETHTSSHETLQKRGNIPGFKLLAAINHPKYGIATYIRNDIDGAEVLSCTNSDDISIITTSVHGLHITNVYKPPAISWPENVLPTYPHPAIYCGDFNSHHSLWRYANDDENGESLFQWSENNKLHLLFDAKDRGSFHSARWSRDSNPDLCFVSSINDKPLTASRSILSDFPQSQHRPAIVNIGVTIPIVRSTPKPRWNFKKADWPKFATKLDCDIRFIPPTAGNFERFVGLVIATAKKCIPRGFRKEYIPCWNEDSDRLYEEFHNNPNPEIADELVKSLDDARKSEWFNSVSQMDFKHSSRKAWTLLRKLGSANPSTSSKPSIDPNLIARHIVNVSKADSDKPFTRKINSELKSLRSQTLPNSSYSHPFSELDISEALSKTKNGTAAGVDHIYPEFIKNSGPRTRTWLARFYTDILLSGNLPGLFKRSKIIALLKPGKDATDASSYRPIALLSVCLKLFERLILNRIEEDIEKVIPPEQAGFRKGRSCTDQVLALTNFIENGYDKMQKTAVSFVDLTAAYDTVWKKGLILKLNKVIPCSRICNIILAMLSDRLFNVYINDSQSKTRKLNNGLPQGSVLAPALFNLYIHDLPATTARKFNYADDMAFAFQHTQFSILENVLESDLSKISSFCRNWRLKPSLTKTEVCCFHLTHVEADRKLSIRFNGSMLTHNFTPKYLGIILDRTLSFRHHLHKSAQKIKSRNNIIQKLAGTSWGATANCLRTSALALVYSTAEYGAPIWLNSHHVKRIDVQLNTTMRLISGTLKATPTEWLPALTNLQPPQLRRRQSLLREYNKISLNVNIPLNADLSIHYESRLKSRNPPLMLAKQLHDENFNIQTTWSTQWDDSGRSSPLFNPEARNNDFDLPRKAWCNLNRLRTSTARTMETLSKWGWATDASCQCGHPTQSIDHIIYNCPVLSFPGNIEELKTITPDAISWLNSLNL